MKKVYIDAVDFTCHETPGEGRFEHEAEYLDDNEEHVESFRYIPEGYVYTRTSDGEQFSGLMVTRLE